VRDAANRSPDVSIADRFRELRLVTPSHRPVIQVPQPEQFALVELNLVAIRRQAALASDGYKIQLLALTSHRQESGRAGAFVGVPGGPAAIGGRVRHVLDR
jgi:hypothetical protein